MTSRRWLVASFLMLLGCASTSARPTADVSDVYFTNGQSGPGSQRYQTGSTPYQVLPQTQVFDRERDTTARIVIVFSTGSAHSLLAVLNSPGGDSPRPVNWSVPSMTQMGTWRTAVAYWNVTPRMSPGRYTVDLTIDGAPAGKYSFELK